MKRKAVAIWSGSGKEGSGHLSTPSNVLQETPYSFNSRFAEGKGTNPEELLAAAHAGCFTMKLSFTLNEAGFTADELHTECSVNLHEGKIDTSALVVKGKVPDISEEKFIELATIAGENCPVSKAFNMEISVDATLM